MIDVYSFYNISCRMNVTSFSVWFLFVLNWRITYLLQIISGLAGATADVHCYDVLTNKWSR